MEFTRIMLGLGLLAGVAALAGAAREDVKIAAPSRKAAPSLADKDRGASPAPPSEGGSRRGGLEDLVEIMSVKEAAPDPGGKRRVTVRVNYVLVHYPKGVLSLGFNLKSATKFVQVTSQPILAGEEECELSAAIVPVEWPKGQPFKVYVSLSAEPHPGQWSLLAASTQVMRKPKN